MDQADLAEVRTTYKQQHPNSFWIDFGDFSLWKLTPKLARLIGGFARAGQVSHDVHANTIKRSRILQICSSASNSCEILLHLPSAVHTDRQFSTLQQSKGKNMRKRHVSRISARYPVMQVTGEQYFAAKPDPIAQFSGPIAAHMNNDHEDATKAIVKHVAGITVSKAEILTLDRLGMMVKCERDGDTFKARIPFSRCRSHSNNAECISCQLHDVCDESQIHVDASRIAHLYEGDAAGLLSIILVDLVSSIHSALTNVRISFSITTYLPSAFAVSTGQQKHEELSRMLLWR